MRGDWARIAAAESGVLLTGCVRGANHCDKNLPCQDASLAGIHYYQGHPYVLLAVADGHGAASYARSELGAHFAVRAAAEAAARWVMFAVDCLEKQPDDWLDNARNEFSQRFVRHLRQSWEANVTGHLAAFPLQPAAPGVEALKPYGTTVALAVVFAGAIGDSTVFLVREEAGAGTAVDLLAGAKADGLGLATDSLASTDAVYKWKHKMLPLAQTSMLLASTDGFADSLADPLQTLAALQRDTEAKGFAWLEGRLDGFLARLTEQGVGDDIATVFYFPPKTPPSIVATETSANTIETAEFQAGENHD